MRATSCARTRSSRASSGNPSRNRKADTPSNDLPESRSVRMQFFRLMGGASLILALAWLATPLHAQPPVADKEYKLINPPQKTESGKQIEVVEFFSYACPHCADFEPYLQSWEQRKPKDVAFKMVPMVFRDSWK